MSHFYLQQTTNVDATNTVQLQDETHQINLCPEGMQCSTSNQKSSKSKIINASYNPTYNYINPYTFEKYYSGEYIESQNNEIDTDDDYVDDDYDYDEDDYDDKSTYLIDNFQRSANTNSAYSRNIPSNKFYDNYANAQSNAPVTYVVSTLPDVQSYTYAYYYPTTKTHTTYKPYDYNYYYYNTMHPNYQNVPNVYRAISSPVSYYYYY